MDNFYFPEEAELDLLFNEICEEEYWCEVLGYNPF